MNLTVGPLPPAVYWRRRALVAGVLVLLILIVAYSCGGSSGSGSPSQRSGNRTSATGSPAPSTSELRPQTGAPPATGDSTSASATASSTAPPAGPAVGPVDPATETCTDAELLLTPSVQRISGGTFAYKLTLRIKNTSTRNCKRDVGSAPQELHVMQNGQTLWSSDSCQAGQGQSSMATLSAGIEYAYDVGWDGTGGTACTGGHPLPPGAYQIVAKLDTKVSAPANFTITGK